MNSKHAFSFKYLLWLTACTFKCTAYVYKTCVICLPPVLTTLTPQLCALHPVKMEVLAPDPMFVSAQQVGLEANANMVTQQLKKYTTLCMVACRVTCLQHLIHYFRRQFPFCWSFSCRINFWMYRLMPSIMTNCCAYTVLVCHVMILIWLPLSSWDIKAKAWAWILVNTIATHADVRWCRLVCKCKTTNKEMGIYSFLLWMADTHTVASIFCG